MSIILQPEYIQRAEVEFLGKHPDVFCSYLAARFVNNLAVAVQQTHGKGALTKLRADTNIQAFALSQKGPPYPIEVSFGGQLRFPDLDVEQIARNAVEEQLRSARYLDHGDYSTDTLTVNTRGLQSQVVALNGTSNGNKFADGCGVVGHYIQDPFGVDGTFPSLRIAQGIDDIIDEVLCEDRGLRPDGKVHVDVQYHEEGYTVPRVVISVAHQTESGAEAFDLVRERIVQKYPGIDSENVIVNQGGDFSDYFLKADAAVSKVKDPVLITGGLHHIGTDGVWGKGLYKASSILYPLVFACAQSICEVTGAKYATVRADSEYHGEHDARLQLEEIDPRYEDLRVSINHALSGLPRHPHGVRDITGMPVTTLTYKMFNDVGGFHGRDKPWKTPKPELSEHIRAAL